MKGIELQQRRLTMRALIIAALLLLPAAPLMAGPVEEQNKRIVSTIFTEIFGQWRIVENEHIYSPDYVGHAGDQHFTRAEDRAAVEGWKTFAPDGKIVEEWNVFDNYSFLSQLELLPKAGG
jgi:predicted SnoaL-like aldol condensation-catalyzing enzyme